MNKIPHEIFKAYDIRGIVDKTLTADIIRIIGQSIGSEAQDRGLTSIAIGHDGRLSGSKFSYSLAKGIQESGINVIDVGLVPTPMLYLAALELCNSSGVMITGSHNPPDYNGLKIMLGGETFAAELIQSLRVRIEKRNLIYGKGNYSKQNIAETYLESISSTIKLKRPIKIIIDCGNGVAGAYAPTLYRRLGCEVNEIFCEVDGTFPNHHPDPSVPENLYDLIHALNTNDAEIGLAFDGDGDRLGVVTKDGNIIYPDRQLMLFATDILSRNPGGKIIFDVKCTNKLAPWIRYHGGKPIMWRTGHSFIKRKLKETGALLAGEMSGHIFFKERWHGFDDGLYAGARLLEILSRKENSSAILNSIPDSINTPELQIKLKEGENYTLISQLQKSVHFSNAERIIKIDGVRAEYKDGFGLARSSNTTPAVILRFEADNKISLKRIQNNFRKAILQIKPDLDLPF
ncbi:MAG: phosphomannomutase/phosphoglucomutase [Nitrosomonadaceae bacterium]|nr:phosphomannomutase/phosphoglucomutase [Nitrosomonadaceae bacterium]|tara:strand:- start:302 stop:1678 length:1377 start_codon:yes stop_codon:yes gene_type:complete